MNGWSTWFACAGSSQVGWQDGWQDMVREGDEGGKANSSTAPLREEDRERTFCFVFVLFLLERVW